jgi:hypothetical protein
MQIQRRLTSGLATAASVLTLSSASGQPISDSEKIERLQRQTELLEQQIKALKAEIAQTRKKTERVESAQAQAAANTAQVAHADAALPRDPKSPLPTKIPMMQKIKITPGGFVAAETVFRSRNTVNDMGTVFNNIPYPFSPLYSEREFHGSARQTRLSLLVEGDIDAAQKLAGYVEGDFLGIGAGSNYTQTNSWAPRLRHGYLTYDNSHWGVHFLAGQSWSLLTQHQVGITPRKENIPLTIDANYVVGFNFTRNWQLRFVKDFGSTFSLGVSIENPATVDGISGTTTTNGVTSVNVNGIVANISNVGTGFLNTVAVTPDVAPDIIVKAAFDPGWGHYEVFGLGRFFTDNTFCADPVPTGCAIGTTDSKTSFGASIGGSVLLPIVPKYLDLQASALYGRGVGRYGTSALPDVTIAPDGSLEPLTGLQALVGVVGHPWEGFDLYAYAGIEQVDAKFFDAGGRPFGYGNPGFNNTGCLIASAASFAGGPAPLGGCVANTKRLIDITGGFWHNVFKGDYGRLAVGAQYAYVRKEAFPGIGGAPKTDDNIVMTSVRYYPWGP